MTPTELKLETERMKQKRSISKTTKIIIIVGLVCFSLFLFVVEEFVRQKNLTTVNKPIEFDDDGIIWKDYGIQKGVYIGKQRNPVDASQTALRYYDDFINSGNSTAKKYFINSADWLISYSQFKGNYSIFEYEFPYPIYNLNPLWHDAMAQGQAIQVLIKAHELTNDGKYLDEAKLLLNAFFVDVKDGGVTYKTEDKGWWYEHYAQKDGKSPRVLNAHIHSLLGVYDYYKYTGDSDAKYIWDQGVLALKNDLPIYDFDSFSYYDSIGTIVMKYHNSHVDLTKQMYDLTNENIFLEYHERWKKCDDFCQFYHKNIARIL